MSDFEAFFAQEYQSVTRALALAFGDRRTAENASQEGFSRALARWGLVQTMEHPAAWVYVAALRYERRRAFRDRIPLLSAARRERDEAEEITNRILVLTLLNLLTPRQRRAVVLRYLADLSLEDVAKALGCKVGTVKATLHQSLGVLGQAIGRSRSDANL
ncbi:MAG TPA: sigma-70 family RNA polymerase sigma factor [Acidimicrobiales bacterium]